MLRMLRDVGPVLDRAGSGAWRDMWLAAPPVAAIAFVLKVLRIRPRTVMPRKPELGEAGGSLNNNANAPMS